MILIHNTNGDIIQRSRNLAGIRRFASKCGVDRIAMSGFTDDTGVMTIYFPFASAIVHFADFSVMQQFVRNWRNARGADLEVNGINRGQVTSKEPVGYPTAVEIR